LLVEATGDVVLWGGFRLGIDVIILVMIAALRAF